jgi:predicted DsbA family dithiol-disulfide isomerase
MATPDNPLTARARQLGLSMVTSREVIPSTRRAHQAAEWARQQGRFDAFHRAVLTRYWERGEDLHALSMLRAAAADAGLDGEALERELASGRWVAPLDAALASAHELGVTAVPTFILNDRLVIQGAQERRTFELALEQLGASRKAS